MAPVSAVLTDIEGTTTPISFVKETLFPYARRALDGFLADHGHEPEVAACLSEARRQAEPGDLAPLFGGFFDTHVGGKREAASYGTIARGLHIAPGEILFLSDVAEELDAASTAGLATCQLLRPADGTQPCERHRQAADFNAVAGLFGLPVPRAMAVE